MRRNTWIVAGVAGAAIVVGGAGVAVAVTAGDDQPLTGETLDRAAAAALEATGGGTVTGTELDDGRYEVEVRGDDGTEIEVTLDDQFAVIAQEIDDDDTTGDDQPLTGQALARATAAALEATGGGAVTDTELDDGRYEVEVRGDDDTEVEVTLDDQFAVIAQEIDDADGDDQPLTGETLDRATAAALEATGGGAVTDTELDDGGYEVEVRGDDGTEIEVTLDDQFTVIAQEIDD